MPPSLTGYWLGQRRYVPTLALQRRLFELRKAGKIGDVSLFLEHSPVITLGRGAQSEHLLESREQLEARGVEVEVTDRGGEITLHTPGQLICYPIVHLGKGRRDVRRYVKDLTAVMQGLLVRENIDSGEVSGWIGVWVDRERPSDFRGQEQALRLEKIGALGVRLSRWVTMHGFALNLCPDMSLYKSIVPCGITTQGVCSLAQISQARIEPQTWARPAWELLGQRLERTCEAWLDLSQLEGPQLEGAIVRHASGGGKLSADIF